MDVIESVRKNVDKDDRILVAVSGGPDSMALLDALVRLRGEVGFYIEAAHVNHGLRAEAAAEEEGVRTYCEANGVPFSLRRVDLDSERYRGLSQEEAGRVARYAFFAELTDKGGFNKLMTAHHLNDQAETVLMRLARGTGPKGACGILPEGRLKNVRVIRPFLSLNKVDLIKYCRCADIPYFTDASNADEKYTRNFLRGTVLPLLEQRRPGAQANIAKFAERMRRQQGFIDDILRRPLEAGVVREDMGVSLDRNLFMDTRAYAESFGLAGLGEEALEYLRVQALRRALELAGAGRDVGEEHLLEADRLFCSGKSGSVNFPGNIRGISNSGVYKIMNRDEIPEPFGSYTFTPPKDETKTFYFPKQRKKLRLKPGLAGGFERPSKESGKALLLKNGLAGNLELRGRKEGDEVFLSGMAGPKKLARYMIDKKIPGFLRDSLPILASGSTVIWIPGYYIHRDFLASSPKDPVIEISLTDI